MRFVTKQNQYSVEDFDSLLEWLDPDRERAGEKYRSIREGLIKIFTWKRCSDAESLADETLDRVMLKVPEVRPTYSGDPALYFYGVAKKVLAEHSRARRKREAQFSDDPEIVNISQETMDIEKMDSCLQRCLSNLSPSNRELVMNYYSEKRTKKHKDMAQELGVSVSTLRVLVYRIRKDLKNCIQTCLEKESRI